MAVRPDDVMVTSPFDDVTRLASRSHEAVGERHDEKRREEEHDRHGGVNNLPTVVACRKWIAGGGDRTRVQRRDRYTGRRGPLLDIVITPHVHSGK